MFINKDIQTRFYQNLGKLFYAIAIADSKIETIEVDALKKAVAIEWSSDSDALSIIDAFDWLSKDKEYTAEVCFKSFIDFKTSNQNLFTANVKQKILRTAIAIASSFSETNKSELILLAKLELELKKD